MSVFIIQNLLETLTEKTEQRSSVAELQEKIGIFLTVFFYVDGLSSSWLVLSLRNCPMFPTSQGRWGSR